MVVCTVDQQQVSIGKKQQLQSPTRTVRGPGGGKLFRSWCSGSTLPATSASCRCHLKQHAQPVGGPPPPRRATFAGAAFIIRAAARPAWQVGAVDSLFVQEKEHDGPTGEPYNVAHFNRVYDASRQLLEITYRGRHLLGALQYPSFNVLELGPGQILQPCIAQRLRAFVWPRPNAGAAPPTTARSGDAQRGRPTTGVAGGLKFR
jgi:hypothetical protein